MTLRQIKKILELIIVRFEYIILSRAIQQRNIAIIYSNNSKKFNNLTALSRALRLRKINFIELTPEISIKNVYLLASSRLVLVDQTNLLISNVKLSKTTKLIQIWHAGGAFKKIAFDACNGTIKDLKRIKRIHGNTSYVVTSDCRLTDIYASAFKIPQKNVLPFGLLRSDEYYGKKKVRDSKRFVLWAPTFRTAANGKRFCPLTASEVNRVQKKLSENGLTLALRLHPSLSWNSEYRALNWGSRNLLDCILNSDTIITDYSSIIFDFSLFDGRIFWYIINKEEYIKERGLYFDPADLFPDFVTHTTDELVLKIISNKTENASAIRNRFMSACDGHACDKLTKFIQSI